MFLSKSSTSEIITYILIYLSFYAYSTCFASEKITSENYLYGQSKLEGPLFSYDDLLQVEEHSNKFYGPVKKNEIIWDIASVLRPDKSIPTVQMVVALFKQNPDAFQKNNLNGLLTGVTLVVPNREQVNQLSKPEVDKIFLQHWKQWKQTQANISNTISRTNGIKANNISTALKTNDMIMSRNKTIIAKNKVMMSKIEGLLNNIEIQGVDQQKTIQHNDTQVSEKASISTEIIALPQTSDEVKSSKISAQTDNTIIATQQKSKSTLEDEIQAPAEEIPLLWQEIKSSIVNAIASNRSIKQQISVVLFIFLFFVIIFSLFLYFIKKRVQIKSITLPISFNLEEVHSIEEGVFKPIRMIKKYPHLRKVEMNLSEIINPSNIRKSLGKKQLIKDSIPRNKSTGILERVFEQDSDIAKKEKPLVKVYPQKFKGDQAKTALTSTPAPRPRKKIKPNVSSTPVKSIIEKTGNVKVDAFYEATQSDNLTYEMLAQEFETIKYNENINIFIEETEQLASSLTVQSSTLKAGSNRIEKLVQFQLSIQSLQELSELIQARQLSHFTQIVLEFLSEIIDGKIKISNRDIWRLLSVVDFYHRYINSVKINQYYKLSV